MRRMVTMGFRFAATLVAVFLLTASNANAADVSPATQPVVDMSQPMWVNHVEPILSKSCFKCHGETKQKGGLDLRQPSSVFAGGTDGAVVTPGRPGESALYQRLQPGAKDHMPPEKEPQLSAEDISFIQEWIAMVPSPADRPSKPGVGVDWNQTAPSLMELATRVKWEPPTGLEGSAAIDYLILSRWREQQVAGNEICDDLAFVRRIYLDLAGRIPTRDETDAFVNNMDAQKRSALVDQLLAGGDYARHMAEVLDVVLMERKGKAAEATRRSRGWFDYLQKSIASNRPWNEMVSDLIVARPNSAEQNGAVWFLYERKNPYTAMAEAVAPIAFGTSVACAQCHNHPLAREIKQAQYWGLVAAFNRTTNVEGGKPALSESAIGGFVNFTNLKKESQPAILLFPNDRTIPEQRPPEGVKEKDSDDNYLVPPMMNGGKPRQAGVPKFSRRAALADAVTHDNPLLARAFVNRMWGLLLGRGIINPVDQMDSQHPASHPELLAWLASDFEKSGYDIKHLIRTIVLSRAYQLDSRWNGSTPPAPELFARGLEKPLPAEVLYRSLLVASGLDPSSESVASDTDALRQALIAAFPDLINVEYNATLRQSMLLTNSPLIEALLKPNGQNLTARLLKIDGNEQRARTAFVEILGRAPDESELSGAVAYMNARNDRPESGVRQLAWALMTSAEFLLNH